MAGRHESWGLVLALFTWQPRAGHATMTGLSFPQEVEVRVQRYHNDNGGLEKGRNLSVPVSVSESIPLGCRHKRTCNGTSLEQSLRCPLDLRADRSELQSQGGSNESRGAPGGTRQHRGELRHPLSTYHVQGSSHPWSHSGPTSTVMKSDGRQ